VVKEDKNIDFVLYGDTDSLFINAGGFFDKHIPEWRKLSDDMKIHYVRKLALIIEDYVNDHAYREIQRKNYNSVVEDFRIKFKQEIIAKTALFVKKKKYAYWSINEEGVPVDKVEVTGLEIVRSDTPEIIRPMLKDVMNMILRGEQEDVVVNKITDYKRQLKKSHPEEIALNIGASDIDKYVHSGEVIKGTPYHLKGINNYRNLLKQLKLTKKYEDIYSGSKVKVVYIKKNSLGIDVMSFLRWPKEFEKVISIDYNEMIDKFFIGKIKILLEPMGKTELLYGSSDAALSSFFDVGGK
jgi:DNA polymerase elongation subunit (family B)